MRADVAESGAIMRRLFLLSLLAVLVLPASDALAAKARISPKGVTVSASGVASVEVANPNRYALRGTATVITGQQQLARKSVRLARRSVGVVKVNLSPQAQEAVRTSGGRVTVALKLRRPGAKKATTVKRTIALRLPAAPQQDAAPQASPAPGPAPAPAGPRRWAGRMGTEGPYDDFELSVDNGQMTFTKFPFVPVSCSEIGGSFRIALSLELFDAPGPFPIGQDLNVEKPGSIAVNTLVNSGAKTINYKVSESAQAADRITGKLVMSFSDSKLDILNGYKMIFINCAGTQSFEAVPAP